MEGLTTDFWEFLLWGFWFFIWITALMVWFRCLVDLSATTPSVAGARLAGRSCSSSCPGLAR
jgi:hypothetical protein